MAVGKERLPAMVGKPEPRSFSRWLVNTWGWRSARWMGVIGRPYGSGERDGANGKM